MTATYNFDNLPNKTFYFDQKYLDINPYLCIKESTEENCGNPWNYLSEKQSDYLKIKCPKCIPLPRNDHNNRTSHIFKFFSNANELENYLKDSILGDCTHISAYNFRNNSLIKNYYTKGKNNRDYIVTNIDTLINDIENGNAIYLCMGNKAFLDIYITKSPNGDYISSEIVYK
jgi:hypothetical protein